MLYNFYALLNFKSIMIYIIHKMSVLLKITLITLKIVLSNAFSREYNKLLLFLEKLINFFHNVYC